MLWLGHRLRHSQLPFALCISNAKAFDNHDFAPKKDELCDCFGNDYLVNIPRFISTCQPYGVVLVFSVFLVVAVAHCHYVQRYFLGLIRCLMLSTKYAWIWYLGCRAHDQHVRMYETLEMYWTWLQACPSLFFFLKNNENGGNTVGTRPMLKIKD